MIGRRGIGLRCCPATDPVDGLVDGLDPIPCHVNWAVPDYTAHGNEWWRGIKQNLIISVSRDLEP